MTFTLFNAVLWRYRTPTIRKKIFDNRDGEKDKTPPEVSSFTDSGNGKVWFILENLENRQLPYFICL